MWSLRLNFLMKMGSSYEGTWSPGLVAGTSRRDQVPSCVPTFRFATGIVVKCIQLPSFFVRWIGALTVKLYNIIY